MRPTKLELRGGNRLFIEWDDGQKREIEIEVSQACETCHGSGATPGTEARRCNLCSGHGKVRAKQGFFVVERLSLIHI